MEILLALILGGAVGAVAHLTLRHRATRGAALGPVLGALVGGAMWAALTWAGQTPDGPWLWTAAVLTPAAVVFPTLAFLGRRREAQDARERVRLKIS